MPTETDVKQELDPSTGLPKATASDQRNDRVMPDGRKIEDVWAENQKVHEKLRQIETEKSEILDRLQELETKAEKTELTISEKKEFSSLSDEERYLEQEAQKLESQTETKPYFYSMNKKLAQNLKEAKTEAEKIAIKVAYESDLYHADCFLEDKAEELGMLDSSGKGDMKALAKLIFPFVSKYDKEYPSRRNVLAFRAYLKDKEKLSELDKKEKAIKEKEDKFNALEGSGRTERGQIKKSFSEMTPDERLSHSVARSDARANSVSE